MKPRTCVNRVITDSIPISKDLKRFLLSRYRKLCSCNGQKYAADVFKHMSEVLLNYRADPNRLENLDGYLKEFPLTRKGWAREVFHYMDCQPMMMLDFLKLYCGMSQPLVTVEASADRQNAYLKETGARVDTRVPGILSNWIRHFAHSGSKVSAEQYLIWKLSLRGESRFGEKPPEWLRHFVLSHDYSEYCEYFDTWFSVLDGVSRVSDQEARNLIETKVPVPEVYKDFNSELLESRSLDTDYWQVCAWLDQSGLVADTGWSDPLGCRVPTLSEESLAYVRSYMTQFPDAMSLHSDVEANGAEFWLPTAPLSLLAGETVGEIQHIPKKGTVKRRPIAVPNRILQMGLIPFQEQLERLVRRLPCDCTFDQGRFDVKIANRVSNPNLYAGSVDLSQATDNLPLDWGMCIVDELFGVRSWPIVKSSYHLFVEMARGRWDNDGIISRWTVGQPLGTLPSFDLLAITHNLLLESLAFSLGLKHSPYCILGDDLLVFNKKLRRAYIGLMQSAGVPLSLHKSYEGNLVEFAGKVFIRNQIPAYRSDHNPITWNSLFDYQRSTGVRIPWGNLPSKLKAKVSKAVVAAGLPASDSQRVYTLAQRCLMDTTGSLDGPLDQRTIDLVAAFYVELESRDDKPLPDRNLTSGIVMVSGHPITFGDFGYASKHGHLQRFREVQLPQWYKDKVRPCATDKAIACAAIALKSN